jgi:hypothetical protein
LIGSLNTTIVEKVDLTAIEFTNVTFLLGLVPHIRGRSTRGAIRLTTGSSGDDGSGKKSEDGELHCDSRDEKLC